jgi:hypothetical protein
MVEKYVENHVEKKSKKKSRKIFLNKKKVYTFVQNLNK